MSANPLNYLFGYRVDEETPGAFYGPDTNEHGPVPLQEQGWHENLEDLIQVGLLNMCGCVDAGSNLLHILRGLEIIADTYTGPGGVHLGFAEFQELSHDWNLQHKVMVQEHFRTRQDEMFFYYWADSLNLTEHGSSLSSGGWLTNKGKNLLALLQIYKEQQSNEETKSETKTDET